MASNDHILVSTTEMSAAIQKYQNAQSTLQDSFTQLDKAKEHLDRCYKGEAYAILAAKFLSIYANCKTAEKGIEESITGLKTTIALMEASEDENSTSYSSLDTGIAPTSFL